jgi:hypothetical protein
MEAHAPGARSYGVESVPCRAASLEELANWARRRGANFAAEALAPESEFRGWFLAPPQTEVRGICAVLERFNTPVRLAPGLGRALIRKSAVLNPISRAACHGACCSSRAPLGPPLPPRFALRLLLARMFSISTNTLNPMAK